MTKARRALSVAMPLLLRAAEAHAQYLGGSSGQFDSFINQFVYWVTKSLGAAFLILGIARWSYSTYTSRGSEDAAERAFWIMLGGGVMFASSGIVSMLKSWAGAF